MKVAVGDILQVDGGLVIIKEVETVRAFCLPLPGFKNLKADIFKHGFGVEQASRNVLERRGAAGLDKFLAEQKHDKKAAKNSMVTLELGDALCYQGERCTVVGVCDDAALLADANGNEYEEAREVNEFLFQDCTCKGAVGGRLDEAGRAANLKAFLAAQQERINQQPAAGAVAPAETTETKKESVMKKATKTEKSKRAAEQIKEGKAKLGGVARPFDLPVKDEIKGHRASGDRATAIAMLLKGATVAQVAKATSWGVERVPKRIWAIHNDQGYGVKEDANGIIKLAS